MQQANSVRIRTNESNLIARLGTVFSSSDKVLSEMMQNARRARATEIRFDYAGGSLTVTDNGTGIDDMQKLLTIAESGWDSETIHSESAFGAGFMSVVYSCEEAIVESKGKSVTIRNEKATAGEAFAVTTGSFIGGTRITLKRYGLTCEEVGSDGVSSEGKKHGYVFEVTADPVATTGVPIIGMGRYAHEAAAIDPANSDVYLTEDSSGRGLLICEDGNGQTQGDGFGIGNRLMGLTGAGDAYVFAKNNVNLSADEVAAAGKSLNASGDYRTREFCGACFDPTGRFLFVNIQTPGITFAISGPWAKGPPKSQGR